MSLMDGYSENSQRTMVFLDALRSALFRIGTLMVVFSIGGYFAAEPIIRFLQRLTGARLVAYGLPETFFSFLTLALGVGLFASIPYVLYAILSPMQTLFSGFSSRNLFIFWSVSILLFYVGAMFSLMVSIPYGVQFLLSFENEQIKGYISVRTFVSFCLMVVFGFGTAFELPLAMMLLGRIGLISVSKLSRYRRYAIIVIAVIAAVLTPTPDVFNMALMGVPLYLLYELGILGMRLWGKHSETN